MMNSCGIGRSRISASGSVLTHVRVHVSAMRQCLRRMQHLTQAAIFSNAPRLKHSLRPAMRALTHSSSTRMMTEAICHLARVDFNFGWHCALYHCLHSD